MKLEWINVFNSIFLITQSFLSVTWLDLLFKKKKQVIILDFFKEIWQWNYLDDYKIWVYNWQNKRVFYTFYDGFVNTILDMNNSNFSISFCRWFLVGFIQASLYCYLTQQVVYPFCSCNNIYRLIFLTVYMIHEIMSHFLNIYIYRALFLLFYVYNICY